MLPHRDYARERIAQTAARLAVHGPPIPLALELSGPVSRGAPAGEYRPVSIGEPLGPLFATYWLRVRGRAPERAQLFLDFGGEATVWHDGRPIEALSSGPRQARMSVPVPAGELELELELACNDPFGYGEAGQGLAMEFRLRRCELAVRRPALWERFHDLAFLLALEDVAEPDRAGELLARLHRHTIDGAPLDGLLARPSGAVHEISAIGHAPPRHGLAVAAGGDLPQARAHHDRAAAAARRLPRARLRALAGAALRVAARSLARSSTRR